ncbi:MAG: Gfo/Idh/MocA family oxidoreductase [Candidatus Latescibacteria bacterium]|nr:Gfo/Idh/MocA family oxidoreductase [Candidatus Latescibacterota bacterium]
MAIKVGFIGTGGISRPHRKHLKNMEDVEVVAMCDLEEDRVKEAAEEWNASIYTDYKAMLESEEMDALYVCIPPFAHEDQEILAAEKGIALFVEKPVSVTMEKAREVDAAIRENNVISCVGFQGRYLDIIDRTKDLLSNRPVGTAMGYWMGGMPGVPWWRRKEMSGGQPVEQTIHVTDMARYLFGDVKSVYAAGRTGLMTDVPDYNIEDGSAATLIFENGIVATIFSACFLSGSRRKGGIDIFTKEMTIEYRERKSITIIQDDNSEFVEVQNDFWQDMDNAFIDAVRKGDGSNLRTNYADATKTQEVVMAVNRSLETGDVVQISDM